MIARRVRLVSNQLALGIRAPRKLCLPQAISALIQSLLQDDLLHACCPVFRNDAMVEHAKQMLMGPCPVAENHPQMLLWLSSVRMLMSMESHPVVENHPQMPSCLPSLRACHSNTHCWRPRRLCG